MNLIQNLLESANPWQSLQNDANRFAKKWAKSGLLEGIKRETDRNNMSIILENQAKQLVVESSLSGGGTAGASFSVGTGEQWAGVALPLVRKVFGQIAAKEFVSVQPMNLPSGLVFFLDFQYGTTKNPFTSGESLYGVTSGSSTANTEANGGLYGAGRFGYSINNTSSIIASGSSAFTTGSATWATFNLDAAYSASATQYKTITVTLPAVTDFNGVRAFTVVSGSTVSSATILSQFTTTNGVVGSGNTGNVTFVTSGSNLPVMLGGVTVYYQLQPTDNKRGDFEDMNTSLNTAFNSASISIPEINVQMRSEAIVAKTRKLKAQWTPEFAQDLNAYQSLDAEAELTSILSEYISLEIDLEILDMLIQNASAGTEYWSAKANQFLTVSGGTVTQVDAAAGSGGYYQSQGGWFQTLGTKLQKISNKIHQKTLRGGANFMVISPTVATIIESIPGFASDTDGAADNMKYAFGVQKMGQLNSRYKVYKNPYMQENTILLGFRGNQFLECGAVYAPYIPLIMTPLVYDPNTFTPRKGIMTRYAKKMVRPEFYGKVFVAGLDTI